MIALDIQLFATADARWQEVCDKFIAGANYQFASYDLVVKPYPSRPNYRPMTIPQFAPVRDGYGEPEKLRLAAQKAYPSSRGIPVIFCYLSDGAGLTIQAGDNDANRTASWPSYILIDSRHRNPQNEVLAHELIHAAGYSGDTDKFGDIYLHDKDPSSIMRIIPPGGGSKIVSVEEKHAVSLRNSYFARPI
ncbi:hypothetical protein [Methylobacterium crusticola]|uniref:hypothetical protein n=1 Tax=Methylobacterium crusticola TaxID=1697972 RepID=UPI000FFC56D5|nr:hypothetical protein [Methylobacterium crusticola]